MKAIYNKTGEIVDIEDMSVVTYKSSDGTYVKTLIKNFTFIDAEKRLLYKVRASVRRNDDAGDISKVWNGASPR